MLQSSNTQHSPMNLQSSQQAQAGMACSQASGLSRLRLQLPAATPGEQDWPEPSTPTGQDIQQWPTKGCPNAPRMRTVTREVPNLDAAGLQGLWVLHPGGAYHHTEVASLPSAFMTTMSAMENLSCEGSETDTEVQTADEGELPMDSTAWWGKQAWD